LTGEDSVEIGSSLVGRGAIAVEQFFPLGEQLVSTNHPVHLWLPEFRDSSVRSG